jgi:hypothetical protein
MFFVSACKKAPVGIPKTPETKEPLGEKRTETEHAKVVLHSSLAGQWYPDDAEALSKQIAEFFQKADVTPKDNVIALLRPDSGFWA